MGISYSETNIHWNYYLAIEEDFKTLSRYIEFSEANNDTYSIELARLLMAAAQETEIVIKELNGLSANPQDANNIGDYKNIIKSKYLDIVHEEVFIHRFGMHSAPWSNLEADKTPEWWTANNHIKHRRNTNFNEANLKNTFNAIGGLLILEYYYHKAKMETEQNKYLDFKDVTNALEVNNPFLKLRDIYYLNFIHI